MATGTEYPRTHGYQTRRVQIRATECICGHGCGQSFKHNGHLLTGKKIAYPYPQTRLTYLTCGATANKYILEDKP